MEDNFTDRELSVATWLVYHKDGVRRISLGIIALIGIGTWGYFLFALADSTLFAMPTRKQATTLLTASVPPLAQLRPSTSPQELVLSNTEQVGVGSSRGTLTTIQNPNTDWIARITETTGANKEQQSLSIAPGDTAYFFSQDETVSTIDPKAVTWQRVHRADVGDIELYKKIRRNFIIKDATYSADTAADGKGTVYRARFQATNATPASYWHVPMLVLFYQGDRVASALVTIFDNFKTGETRNGDIVLTDPIGGVSTIEVIPQIDIFDPAAVMPLPQSPKPELGS